MIEGHKIKFNDFGRIELELAFNLSNYATRGLSFNKDTFEDLQSLANKMFEDYKALK